MEETVPRKHKGEYFYFICCFFTSGNVINVPFFFFFLEIEPGRMDEDRDVERTKVGSFFIVYFQGNVINAFLFFF